MSESVKLEIFRLLDGATLARFLRGLALLREARRNSTEALLNYTLDSRFQLRCLPPNYIAISEYPFFPDHYSLT